MTTWQDAESAIVRKVPVRAVIADDEPLARNLLASLLDLHTGIDTVGVAANGQSARRIVADTRPDVVFLDIEMPGANGIEVAEMLGEVRPQPLVVFVTAHSNFAPRAFDIAALDYVVKPISKVRFAKTIARVRRAILARAKCNDDPRQAAYVVIRQRDEIVRVAESEILWLEAASQYVHVHTTDQSYLIAEPLRRYHKRLQSPSFLRVHRSAVVNRDHVRHVFRRSNGVHELHLDNGTAVPLSRSRKHMVGNFLHP